MILVRPTARGKLMLITFVIAVATAFVNVNMTTCLIASFLGGLLFASFFLAFFSLYRISLKRLSSNDGIKGSKLLLPVTVTNKSWRRRQAVVISENCDFVEGAVCNTVVAPLASSETRVVSRVTVAISRGIYKLDKVKLIGGDPAGFFAREKRFSYPDEVMIYPEVERLAWMPIRIRKQQPMSTEGRPIGVSGLGQDFFGVREYRPSDGMRFIHWKASAKHKKLLVKEFESHAVSQVCVVLDVDKSFLSSDDADNNFEFLVKTVASITDYLYGMYCRILFVSADKNKEVVQIEGEAFGVKQNIINFLTDIEPVDYSMNDLLDASLEMFQSNSILYCLSMSEPKEITSRFDILLEKNVDIRWIYAPKSYFDSNDFSGFVESSLTKMNMGDYLGVRPFIANKASSISKMLSYG